jgi:hypothetical protein
VRARLVGLLGVLLAAGSGSVHAAETQPTAPGRERTGSMSEVVLPCGVRAALAAIGDRSTPDRGYFMLEIARRLHHMPVGPKVQRTDALRALMTHLERCEATGSNSDMLPLPLPVAVWQDQIFGGRVAPERLAAAILESRNASLLYVALLSLDDTTRDWIAGQPELIAEIGARHTAPFTLIAPGLRVTNGGVLAPGGPEAEAVWEALAGKSPREAVKFVRALLSADDRYLPYMFGTLARLSPAQARFALQLDGHDQRARVASGRRLHAAYVRVAQGWRMESRVFWRPHYDPALLASDLPRDDDGRPMLPGSRRFWTAVLDGGAVLVDGAGPDEARANGAGGGDVEPVDFAWLCERIFEGRAAQHGRRYQQVLFASRLVRTVNAEPALAAVEAVRAAQRYPALVAALERADISAVDVIAAAAARAGRLSNIGGANEAALASAQFQGLLALLQRAVLKNGITSDRFAELVTAMTAVDFDDGRAYRGRLLRWLDQQLQPRAASAVARDITESFEEQPMERALLDLAAGAGVKSEYALRGEATEQSPARAPRIIDWEGIRYRVDFAAAESKRLDRLRGNRARPYVSAARALLGVADILRDTNPSPASLTRAQRLFARVEQAVGWTTGQNWRGGQPWSNDDVASRARGVASELERAAQAGDGPGAARLAPDMLALSDALFARGLIELVYATALGRPERAGFWAEEAAAQHDFGIRLDAERSTIGTWEHPELAAGDSLNARVTGSLLGLDAALAPFALVRLSSKLPPGKPSLNETERRTLTETVALVRQPEDADRDRIAAAIRKGRDRLAGAGGLTPDQARAIAAAIGLDGPRRTLLIWNAAHASDRVAGFLSPSELLWLGLEPAADRVSTDARLNMWGGPARPRLGCLCLQMLDRQPLDPFTGRWGSGIFASAFPDLNLRLAELLNELRMPAALLGPVLTAATPELVTHTVSRDADDRRALVDFVASLTVDRLEQYLALLTTDGPLVPIGKAPQTMNSAGVP